MVIPAKRKNDEVVLFKTRLMSLSLSAVSSSMIMVRSVPPVVVRLPAPKTESAVLADGTFKLTLVVQWQVPEGMLIMVVEAVAALKAACTSVCEQLAALMV